MTVPRAIRVRYPMRRRAWRTLAICIILVAGMGYCLGFVALAAWKWAGG